MAELVLDGLTKRFGDNVVLKDLSLTVTEGEILTLLGPSGCGKSTTLWSIAGLHRPDSGTIRFGDRVLFDGRGVHLEPEQRNFGVVFQSYAIWPHMSVADNVGYPLKLRKVGRKQRRERVMEVLELVELDRFADRYPHQLSGGQQQRVALARALAHPPHLLLLDEPFSNLDAKLRDRAREWLKALQRQIGVTTVFVTHDQHEALSMSDRIVVMESGVIHQTGTPTEVYEHPADPFVADFVGAANLLAGDVLQSGARPGPGADGRDRPAAPGRRPERGARPGGPFDPARGHPGDGRRPLRQRRQRSDREGRVGLLPRRPLPLHAACRRPRAHGRDASPGGRDRVDGGTPTRRPTPSAGAGGRRPAHRQRETGARPGADRARREPGDDS
ncbi:ATP-binding cassette domain-containing protein [Actinomadura madurae]|nr:ATP-binding cassette domain-containing protein [Actinomadura madurae]MCQ0013632.1 ATP-binding cassette domain-containing protein [Actinomadura madurae]